ncbi:tyrosine-type recombinase/integrase [Chengkuizengella marina]|uniref:Site-specific integrase n=1 Tax=Chengkuizengella marina TaxID=2507566 RepID=A0A6N9Q3P8_9BACL|nr:site-specific integrase [Chengkuizengella marina]NBI29459.1 site-specific integrase [Chengkuizengella marina]
MASIEKRGKKSWRLIVEVGYGPNNKRIKRSKTIRIEDESLLKTKKKLRDYLNEELVKFKIEVEAGEYIAPEKMKFKDFVEEWKEKYASEKLSPKTFKNYNDHLKSRIIPSFGHKRIDQITSMQIVTFLKELQKPGARKDGRGDFLEVSTIQYIYRILKNIFSRATEWKLIPINPMKDIKSPILSKKEAVKKKLSSKETLHYYDENEAQEVISALYKESSKWRLLVLGSMIGGFRRGELVGLEWSNVDFDENVLRIKNNIALTVKGIAVEGDPKSLSSIRSVDMPGWYMKELEQYYDEWIELKDELGNKWIGGEREFVFHNGYGKTYYYEHPSKWWKRFCKRHNIRYIKFHGLRHSSGTLLIEDESGENVDSLLKAIQERLGHSRYQTTADIYAHVTKKVRKRTAGKFDKFSPEKTVPNSSPIYHNSDNIQSSLNIH